VLTVLLAAHRSRRGGFTEHLRALAGGLRARGARPVVALPRDSEWASDLGEIETATEAVRGRGDALAPVRYARLARALRADLVHTHARPTDLWAGLGARLAGASAVATLHAEPGREPDGSVRAGARARAHGTALDRLHARVIAVAHPIADQAVARLGIDRRRVRVVENGVELVSHDTSVVRPRARAALGAREGELAVGVVARFVDRADDKGQPAAVRALARLGLPGAVLHFVGDGPTRGEVERLARELGVAARFHGERRDARALIPGFDVALLPSLSEGCPLFVLEAMAASVPLVATAVGGVPDVLAEGAGSLVPAGDDSALAREVGRLARDAELRARLGRAGRARAEARYSASRFVGETLAVYEEALASRRRRARVV
jgi:glycosyltransferase involved in cell wall biosynthesis